MIMVQDPGIHIVTIPRGDEAFRRAVDEAAALAASDGGLRPDVLERLVRGRYPDACVREQDGLARLGVVVVWYAYRDAPGDREVGTNR